MDVAIREAIINWDIIHVMLAEVRNFYMLYYALGRPTQYSEV